jgi:hypothetical protein
MSLMAEQIVEEWLNRQGYFTIRGARVGTGEMDLLAIRPSKNGMECWHYEVQASLRPVSYICPAHKQARKGGTAPFNAMRRSDDDMRQAVEEWVHKKFHDEKKRSVRQRLCDKDWQLGLVLGNVKHSAERQAIEAKRIKIVELASIIRELKPQSSKRSSSNGKGDGVNAAGGNDLIELVWAQQSLKSK